MKVAAIPRFDLYFELPLEYLKALQKIAAFHYDSTCKEAGTDRGIIGMWVRNVEAYTQINKEHEGEEDYSPCSLDICATTRELDLCMKIMEQMYFYGGCKIITDDELRMLIETNMLFRSLFRKACDLYEQNRTEWDEPLGLV